MKALSFVVRSLLSTFKVFFVTAFLACASLTIYSSFFTPDGVANFSKLIGGIIFAAGLLAVPSLVAFLVFGRRINIQSAVSYFIINVVMFWMAWFVMMPVFERVLQHSRMQGSPEMLKYSVVGGGIIALVLAFVMLLAFFAVMALAWLKQWRF